MSSSEERPLVSVVTVTYNAAGVVGETLSSIEAQTSRNYEWLVVDGLSTDETLAVVGSDRTVGGVTFRRISEKDLGLYDAMNKAIALARGEYVIFINAGDAFFDSEVISDFERFISGSRPAMVYGHTHVQFSDGKSFRRMVRPLGYIWHGQPTIHQAVFFRRDIHAHNLYPFQRFPISADYAVIAKIQRENLGEVLVWDRMVSVFDNDPASFGNRQLWQRVKDAWNVQRDILRLPIDLRFASVIKRLAANVFYNFR